MGKFHFKFFSVEQSDLVFKITTDSILLGAWCTIEQKDNVLDIGSGTGVLSLIVAQRSDCKLIGLDINPQAIELTRKNFENSIFRERLSIVESHFENYIPPHPLNLIICNPPYFIKSKQNSSTSISYARHQIQFSFEDLFCYAKKSLSKFGVLAICIPFNALEVTLIKAASQSLYLNKLLKVRHTKKSPYSIVLLEFSKVPSIPKSSEIILFQNSNNERSNEFNELVKDLLK